MKAIMTFSHKPTQRIQSHGMFGEISVSSGPTKYTFTIKEGGDITIFDHKDSFNFNPDSEYDIEIKITERPPSKLKVIEIK